MAPLAKTLDPSQSLLPDDMMPAAAPPPVPAMMSQAAPATPNPLQQNISNDQQQLQKVRWAQQNPWGTANNHPGVVGKIAHVLSTAGQIAGDIFAPSAMALAPGTNLNRDIQEGHLTHRLNEEQEEESQNQSRDAGTQATQLANANEPEKAKLGNELTQSTIDKNNADAAPKPVDLAHAYGVAVQRAIAEGRDPLTDPVVGHLSDAIQAIQKQPAESGVGKTTDITTPQGIRTMGYDPKTGKYDIDNGPTGYRPPVTRVETPTEQRGAKNDILKAYQPTLDSAERMNVMTESYEKAVKDHDQQAMLNLLANHLGMTMGLQKGARMTKDIVNEAKQSQPWLQGIESKFDKDGYLTGVTLSPNQMRQMVGLGQSRYAEDAKKSRATAQYLGAPDDGPERVPGKSTINYYLGLTHGDPNKAKELATQDGWTVK